MAFNVKENIASDVMEDGMIPTLQALGDSEDQGNWPHLEALIPHYESFWVKYVFPLRSEGAIWFKRGIDHRLESMAIASYSAFTALARARHKIFEEHEGYRHIEELYMQLQRAGEVGVKLIKEFNDIEGEFLAKKHTVNAGPLESLIESRLKKYRNLLHDAALAIPKGELGYLIPKPDKLLEYAQWSKTMFHFRDGDFVSAESQVKGDFFATASTLEAAWKAMSTAFDSLILKVEFQRVLHQGDSAVVPSSAVSLTASGNFSIGKSQTESSGRNVFTIVPLPKRR
jgi:hypothetical protein